MTHYMCNSCLNDFKQGTNKRKKITITRTENMPKILLFCCSCLQEAWPVAEYNIVPDQYDCDCYNY
jgi:hypothetical protein